MQWLTESSRNLSFYFCWESSFFSIFLFGARKYYSWIPGNFNLDILHYRIIGIVNLMSHSLSYFLSQNHIFYCFTISYTCSGYTDESYQDILTFQTLQKALIWRKRLENLYEVKLGNHIRQSDPLTFLSGKFILYFKAFVGVHVLSPLLVISSSLSGCFGWILNIW